MKDYHGKNAEELLGFELERNEFKAIQRKIKNPNEPVWRYDEKQIPSVRLNEVFLKTEIMNDWGDANKEKIELKFCSRETDKLQTIRNFYESKITANRNLSYSITDYTSQQMAIVLRVPNSEQARQYLARHTQKLCDTAYNQRSDDQTFDESFIQTDKQWITALATVNVVIEPTATREQALSVYEALTQDNLLLRPLIEIVLNYFEENLTRYLPKPIKADTNTQVVSVTPDQHEPGSSDSPQNEKNHLDHGSFSLQSNSGSSTFSNSFASAAAGSSLSSSSNQSGSSSRLTTTTSHSLTGVQSTTRPSLSSSSS